MSSHQSRKQDLRCSYRAEFRKEPRSILKVILGVIISDVILGFAAYGQAMSGCHPLEPTPMTWKEEDMDTLLSTQVLSTAFVTSQSTTED